MRSAIVTLGGVQYTINELPSRRAAQWRQSMQIKLGDVSALIESAPETDISSGVALANLVRDVGSTLIGSTDTLVELLFAYAPAMAADRERIENECYDSELIAAFVEVVKLAYPFGQLANLVARFDRGAVSRPTSTS